MTGFDRELRQKVVDFDAHITVTTQEVLREWPDLMVKINSTEGVVASADVSSRCCSSR
jgi:ABC-type lipoprotein release transport system permease subunit